jgi:hypothetical protein
MRNSAARALLCVAFTLTPARAQTATPTPEATGSVSGHVYCADTNQQARLATVTLQPAPEKRAVPPTKRIEPEPPSAPPSVRTGLDGSFLFSNVKPGTYFLIADYPGYVSPLATFAPEALRSDAPADIEKVEKALVRITVVANKDSTADIELERGAAIAGTVSYDDGSPANEVQVSVLRVGEDGKITPVSIDLSRQIPAASQLQDGETNDRGHYRISGLLTGRYVLKATLPTQTSSYGGLFGGPAGVTFRTDDAIALSVYSGNVFREKDAKPFEVTIGSEREDLDITMPLLGLHTVSGSVSALADGHAVSWGTVSLLFADDQSELRTSDLRDDGHFNFRFVPEGEYILRVTNPADVSEEVQDTQEPGLVRSYSRRVHLYTSIDLPVSVHSDVSNVNVSLPDKPADKASATAQKQ